jgi:hypothetical protein
MKAKFFLANFALTCITMSFIALLFKMQGLDQLTWPMVLGPVMLCGTVFISLFAVIGFLFSFGFLTDET